MGFKFRRFRAKLDWKTKKTTPEVVCLRYQIKSEFTELSPPFSRQEPVELNNSTYENNIKHKNENTTTIINTDKLQIPINIEFALIDNDTKKIKDDIKQNLESESLTTLTNGDIIKSSSEARSILKKVSTDNTVVNTELNGNNEISIIEVADLDDHKKSTETENHEDNKEIENIRIKADNTSNYRRNKYKDSRYNNVNENLDTKQVNWRETVEVIPSPTTESESDFKIHFETHTNVVDQHSDPESEDEGVDDIEVNTYYGNRTTYSSQAASIFFEGEEPQPTARIRNHSSNEISSA